MTPFCPSIGCSGLRHRRRTLGRLAAERSGRCVLCAVAWVLTVTLLVLGVLVAGRRSRCRVQVGLGLGLLVAGTLVASVGPVVSARPASAAAAVQPGVTRPDAVGAAAVAPVATVPASARQVATGERPLQRVRSASAAELAVQQALRAGAPVVVQELTT